MIPFIQSLPPWAWLGAGVIVGWGLCVQLRPRIVYRYGGQAFDAPPKPPDPCEAGRHEWGMYGEPFKRVDTGNKIWGAWYQSRTCHRCGVTNERRGAAVRCDDLLPLKN